MLAAAAAGLAAGPLRADTVLLTPSADTYIRENLAGTPQGTSNVLVCNLGATTTSKRWVYLRFDLTGFAVTNLQEAQLVLWNTGAGGSGSSGLAFNTYGLLNASDTWSESALTWNNDPNRTAGAKTLVLANTYGGAELAHFTSTSGATAGYETLFDATNGAVLDFIKSSPDLSRVTFVIYQDVNSGASGDAWASKEDATVSHWPTLTLSTTVATNSSSPQILKVLLQGGQSNSDGRAPTNGLSGALLQPQGEVLLYYYVTGGAANSDGTLGTLTTLRPGASAGVGVTGPAFGPELSFGRGLADYFARTNHAGTNLVQVALLKYAHGGTSLYANWAANGSSTTNGEGADYRIFQNVVASGLAKLAATYPSARIELDGMIWVQGETDIDMSSGQTGLTPNPAVVASYGANLTRLISDMRATFGAYPPYGTNWPFFLSRISTNQTAFSYPTNPAYPCFTTLRGQQALAAASLTNVFLIDTDGSAFSVGAIGTESSVAYGRQHYDTSGQQALGSAFAQSVIQALPRPVMTPPAKSTNGGWRLGVAGVSGTSNVVERAPSAAGPWQPLTNFILGPTGATNFDDASGTNSTLFYRAARPQA
jgi:hypothetical protein